MKSKNYSSTIHKLAGSTGLKLFGMACGMITSIFLARELGAQQFGIYAFVLGAMSVAMIPFQMGLPTLVIRQAAFSHSSNSWSSLLGILRFSNAAILIGGILIISLALFSRWVFDVFQMVQGGGILLAGVVVLVSALSGIRSAAMTGLSRVIMAQIPDMLVRPLLFIFFAVTFLYIDRLDYNGALAANAFASLVALLLGWLAVFYVFKKLSVSGTPSYGIKAWLASVIPLGFSFGASQLNAHIDIVYIGALLGPSDAGVYKIATLVALQVSFCNWVVNSVFAPRIATAYKRSDVDELRLLVRRGAYFSLLTGVPILLLVIFFGEFGLRKIAGDEYGVGYWSAVILGIGQALSLTAGPVGILLAMCERERYMAVAALVSLVVNLCLCPLLIVYMGNIGAALSTALCFFLWRVILIRMSRKLFTELDKSKSRCAVKTAV